MPLLKPLGVLLALALVLALVPCLVLVLWGLARAVGRRERLASAMLAVAAAGIFILGTSAVYGIAPKGARTIAELHLPDGHTFLLRHYRHGWFEYPKVRFFARDPDGVTTAFQLIAELVDPNAPVLEFDEAAQKVVLPGVGDYDVARNVFIHIDGDHPSPETIFP